MSILENFCEARQYLVDSIEPLVDTFLTGIWDPCIKFTLIRDTNKIIEEELQGHFPELPVQYLPKVKVRIHEEIEQTEISIQNFLNRDSALVYLGSVGIGAELFDLYIRESYDPRFDYVFEARYGHNFPDYYSGSRTAEAEYKMGAMTPLAVAYGMAIDEGII
jgi:hypothetical protein